MGLGSMVRYSGLGDIKTMVTVSEVELELPSSLKSRFDFRIKCGGRGPWNFPVRISNGIALSKNATPRPNLAGIKHYHGTLANRCTSVLEKMWHIYPHSFNVGVMWMFSNHTAIKDYFWPSLYHRVQYSLWCFVLYHRGNYCTTVNTLSHTSLHQYRIR